MSNAAIEIQAALTTAYREQSYSRNIWTAEIGEDLCDDGATCTLSIEIMGETVEIELDYDGEDIRTRHAGHYIDGEAMERDAQEAIDEAREAWRDDQRAQAEHEAQAYREARFYHSAR